MFIKNDATLKMSCVVCRQNITFYLQICLYDTKDDRWVSDTIKKTGMWEGDLGKFRQEKWKKIQFSILKGENYGVKKRKYQGMNNYFGDSSISP